MVDAVHQLVYGILSEEVRYKSDEILDYATAKPAFEKRPNDIKEASGGKSLGNVRAMHKNKPGTNQDRTELTLKGSASD
jgi:hypothetical protein